MSISPRSLIRMSLNTAILVTAQLCAFAQNPVPPVPSPCQRFTAGSVTTNPPALYSQNGVLNVQFSYQTTTDSVGRQLYCYMTPDGLENPTLHVNAGDTLNITVTNNTPTTRQWVKPTKLSTHPIAGIPQLSKYPPARRDFP